MAQKVDDHGLPGMKICIVSSVGGHLTEIRALIPLYGMYDHFYILNDRVPLPKDMAGKTLFIRHSERDWRFFLNLWEAWDILKRERPNLILSTGAGPIVPFSLIGHFLKIPTIFIESFTRIKRPSLTGRIMYCLATRFFYQWKSLERFFPKGVYCGPLV